VKFVLRSILTKQKSLLLKSREKLVLLMEKYFLSCEKERGVYLVVVFRGNSGFK